MKKRQCEELLNPITPTTRHSTQQQIYIGVWSEREREVKREIEITENKFIEDFCQFVVGNQKKKKKKRSSVSGLVVSCVASLSLTHTNKHTHTRRHTGQHTGRVLWDCLLALQAGGVVKYRVINNRRSLACVRKRVKRLCSFLLLLLTVLLSLLLLLLFYLYSLSLSRFGFVLLIKEWRVWWLGRNWLHPAPKRGVANWVGPVSRGGFFTRLVFRYN